MGGGGIGAVQSQNTAEDRTASHPQRGDTLHRLLLDAGHAAAVAVVAADRSHPQVTLVKTFPHLLL